MTFLYPKLLALLAIPVIVAFWEWVRPGQPLAMPFDHAKVGRGRFWQFLINSANCLPACLLAVAILFLAHPVIFNPPEVERQLTNVQIVLDNSGSMRSPHGPQNGKLNTRFDSAMASIEQFLHHRKGDAFGLTVFSRSFVHWVPLTLDTETIILSKPFVSPNVFPDEFWGNTFIGKALYGAADLLDQAKTGDRMIIMLTDGLSSDILPPKDSAIIADLQAKRIKVFVVFLIDQPVTPSLVGIAQATGGDAWGAVTPDALNAVFKRIDEMKKVVVLEKKPRASDYYDPFFIPAMAALGLAILALFGIRYNPW
ncbi:MAG: VWA domain-containing protein [Verrucomicrobia bacterium]|nr:VWA domain-containing protein [Verrucomicrobiota bacterium]